MRQIAKLSGQKGSGGARPRAHRLVADLRGAILRGDFALGDKLPSEATLTARYEVSRTVVREAIAGLRLEGLIESRQGAGVFVIGTKPASAPGFAAVDGEKLSSIVEMMEFRIAVESEAAGLAATRRSPAQEAQMHEALEALVRASRQGAPTGRLDFDLHMAIARAANNPRFEQFLALLGPDAIPRNRVSAGLSADPGQYQAQLSREHAEIVVAIAAQDAPAARRTMRNHLESGLRRYRELRSSADNL